MKIDDPIFIRRIFDLTNGLLDLNAAPVAESQFVQDAFGEGEVCERAYREALEAYSRLCRRLNAPDQEDPDVEIIFNCFLQIIEEIGIKMYEYGAFFARKEKTTENPGEIPCNPGENVP